MKTTTGHTLRVNTNDGTLEITGDLDTMDRIPADEFIRAAEAFGYRVTWREASPTAYHLEPLP